MKGIIVCAVLCVASLTQAAEPCSPYHPRIANGRVRVLLYYSPRGCVYAEAPYDEQAVRKIEAGNYGALGVNTRGLTHMRTWERLPNGRLFLR